MRLFTMIMGFMMLCVFFMTLFISLTSYNEEAAVACLVSGVLFFICVVLNVRVNTRYEILQRRRRRDKRKYGNKDFTQEDEIIYKALKQKS